MPNAAIIMGLLAGFRTASFAHCCVSHDTATSKVRLTLSHPAVEGAPYATAVRFLQIMVR